MERSFYQKDALSLAEIIATASDDCSNTDPDAIKAKGNRIGVYMDLMWPSGRRLSALLSVF